MRDALRTRPFDLANYINVPDGVFAYLEVLRAEDAGDPGAWNSALADLLACDSGRALPFGCFAEALHEAGLRIRIEPVQINGVQFTVDHRTSEQRRDDEFEAIKRGLNEAIAQAKGEAEAGGVRIHVPDVSPTKTRAAIETDH